MKVDDAEPETEGEARDSFRLDLGFGPSLGSSRGDQESDVPESNFALSLPFEKQRVADLDDSPSDAEIAGLAALLGNRADGELSAGVAERERIARPEPTIYLPGNKQRNSRSILTIIISALAVLALVAVGILFAVKSHAPTPQQQAFDAYTSRQLVVAKADRTLSTAYDRFQAARADVDAINVESAAALAAVVGVSDETTRAATDTLRLAFAAAVAELVVDDPADTPYVVPNVTAESSLSAIAAGVDGVAVEAARIEDAQLALDTSFTALNDQRGAFVAAFANFARTIPATSTVFLSLYPDADQEWRDAVTNSANALTSAVENGLGASEMQAYAAAAYALQSENARVVAENARDDEVEPDSERETPNRPPDTPTDPVAPSPDPGTPPPTSPAPSPVPPTSDEPEPEPEPPAPMGSIWTRLIGA